MANQKKQMQPPNGLAVSDKHLIIGWWSLLVFLTLGIALEGLHAFKVADYLGADAEMRRLMWTLAHTHGTLLSLVHIAFAVTLARLLDPSPASLTWASLCLTGAGVLMPVGFFLGGLFHYSGDPGLGILLVPPGGIMLLVAVVFIAMSVTRHTSVNRS